MLSTGLLNSSTDSIKYFSLILNHFFFIGNGEAPIFLHKASDLALLPFDVAVRIEVQKQSNTAAKHCWLRLLPVTLKLFHQHLYEWIGTTLRWHDNETDGGDAWTPAVCYVNVCVCVSQTKSALLDTDPGTLDAIRALSYDTLDIRRSIHDWRGHQQLVCQKHIRLAATPPAALRWCRAGWIHATTSTHSGSWKADFTRAGVRDGHSSA